MNPLRRSLVLTVIALLTACAGNPLPGQVPARRPASTGLGGTVAMPDSFSADVAARILSAGGNAVDAAVAGALVLAVTYPEAGNLGGGGFMLTYVDGAAQFLDYRETAPAAATRDMYLDATGEVIEGSSLTGHRAVGVPGTVAGLWAAHQRYGRLPWRDVIEPAVQLAQGGFHVPPLLLSGPGQNSRASSAPTSRSILADCAMVPGSGSPNLPRPSSEFRTPVLEVSTRDRRRP